jgi:hypothetical protein
MALPSSTRAWRQAPNRQGRLKSPFPIRTRGLFSARELFFGAARFSRSEPRSSGLCRLGCSSARGGHTEVKPSENDSRIETAARSSTGEAPFRTRRKVLLVPSDNRSSKEDRQVADAALSAMGLHLLQRRAPTALELSVRDVWTKKISSQCCNLSPGSRVYVRKRLQGWGKAGRAEAWTDGGGTQPRYLATERSGPYSGGQAA